MSNLMPGDVFPFGEHNYIAVMVNDSRCRALPLDSSVRIVKFGDKEVALRDYGRQIDISQDSLVQVLERRGEAGAREFLRSRKASAPESKPDASTNNETETMKKTETKSNLRPLKKQPEPKTKPRGGFAAELAAAKEKLPALAGDKPVTPKPAKVPKVKNAVVGPNGGSENLRSNRKSRLRELYLSQPPLTKEVIFQTIWKEFGGKSEKAVRAAVNNESSYMVIEGLKPNWAPKEKTPESVKV